MGKSKKSVFVVSLYYRDTTEKKNPKPGKPKYKLKTHKIPLLVISKVSEMIHFLDAYTDFDKFCNSDKLQKKEDLKTSFCIDITQREKLQKDILWQKQGYSCDNYFEENYKEHLLDIDRLPVGVTKRETFEDLF